MLTLDAWLPLRCVCLWIMPWVLKWVVPWLRLGRKTAREVQPGDHVATQATEGLTPPFLGGFLGIAAVGAQPFRRRLMA